MVLPCSLCFKTRKSRRCSVCKKRRVCKRCLYDGARFQEKMILPRCRTCKRITCWDCIIVCWEWDCKGVFCVLCKERKMHQVKDEVDGWFCNDVLISEKEIHR